MKQEMSIQVSSDEDSWGTPSHIIEKCRNVLGEIDLDPASNVEANKIVKARRIFTKEDNMLSQELRARTVFLNPPFGKVQNKSQAGIFSEYVISEFENRNITDGGIILLHSRFGYDWFEKISDRLIAVNLRERLRFIDPKTGKSAGMAKTSQTLFVFGNQFIDKFVSEFRDLGRFLYHPKLKGKLF